MYRILLTLISSMPLIISAQVDNDSTVVDTRYLEDQFYVGVTYNFLLNQPEDVEQQNVSYGLQGGFIKDIPFNSARTIGIGMGLGLGINTYYSNIQATENTTGISYEVLDDSDSYKRSKIETYSVALPLEFRWRNSTATEYKFWRVYTGVKFAYVFSSQSKFVPEDSSDDVKTSFSNPDSNQFQYGLTFNFGYSGFNAHVYYALTNLLNDQAFLGEESITMKPLSVGLIFYIL